MLVVNLDGNKEGRQIKILESNKKLKALETLKILNYVEGNIKYGKKNE